MAQIPQASGPAADPLTAEWQSLVRWWQDAGVDSDFSDTPQAWLAETPAPDVRDNAPDTALPDPVPQASPAAATAIDRSPTWQAQGHAPHHSPYEGALPQDMASWRQFWLTETALSAGGSEARAAPFGPDRPDVLILSAVPSLASNHPILDDAEAALMAKFHAAAQVPADATLYAALVPQRIEAPDFTALRTQGFGRLARHLVRLAQPRALVVLGNDVTLTLHDHDPPNSPANLRDFNHDGLTIPMMTGFALRALLRQPALKAKFWSDWLDLRQRAGL